MPQDGTLVMMADSRTKLIEPTKLNQVKGRSTTAGRRASPMPCSRFHSAGRCDSAAVGLRSRSTSKECTAKGCRDARRQEQLEK